MPLKPTDCAVVLGTKGKVQILEEKLLSAEELIIHLRAEKLELRRKLERQDTGTREPTTTAAVGTKAVSPAHKERLECHKEITTIEDLTLQIQVDQQDHEEKVAVIVDQEQELARLKDRLRAQTQTIETLKKRNEHLVDEVERLERLNRILSEEQEEEAAEKDLPPDPAPPSPHQMIIDDEWKEEIVRHPTPHFDLNSPEVTYLLAQWSQNPKKLNYLKIWMQKVLSGQIVSLMAEFPNGLELPKLKPEIRDGFLTLVVPLLRRQRDIDLHVHVRQHDAFHYDLRLRAIPHLVKM